VADLRIRERLEAIRIQMFHLGEIERACLARGWRFVTAQEAERG
jgi:hypothetical protein